MPSVPKTRLSRYGGWLPSRVVHESFIQCHTDLAVGLHKKYRADHPQIRVGEPLPSGEQGPHVPSVQAFADAINADPVMKSLLDQIFLQASSLNQVKDFDTLLFMLDLIVVQPPKYHLARDSDGNETSQPIGVPIYLIIDLLSNTSAGYDLFRMDQFNVAMKKLLVSWGNYLADPSPPAPLPCSNSTLNEGPEGWFGTRGIASLETNLGHLSFAQTYICPDPGTVNRGFATWDDFFVRELQPDVRPIILPSGPNDLIYNACESTVYRKATNVQLHDQFWLKDQKYSLYDMLNGHAYAEQLAGGTVYQAFLSPADYHRWHSPVKGTILDAFIVPGTYYAALPDAGEEIDASDIGEYPDNRDPYGALIRSQAFLTVAATRALIFIQAAEPLGLMCFIGVGMAEVSTCGLSVQRGDSVEIGQELGMFHFGGSSHALIFRPGIEITWADVVEEDTHLWINSIIGQFKVL